MRNNEVGSSLGDDDEFAYFTHELSQICQNNNGIQKEKWRHVINLNSKYDRFVSKKGKREKNKRNDEGYRPTLTVGWLNRHPI